MRYRSGVGHVEHLGPTHSLPPGRPWNIWHGMMQRGCVKRVRCTARALATNAEQAGCRVKRKTRWGPSGKHKNWRCEPLSFAYFSLRRQRKVGAAPHRGDA